MQRNLYNVLFDQLVAYTVKFVSYMDWSDDKTINLIVVFIV